MPSIADQGAELLAIYDQAVVDVHGYLFARCRDRSTAEDLTAEVFMGAVDGIRRSVPSQVTTAWLIGIARHKLVDHWRRAEREQRRLPRRCRRPGDAPLRRPVGRRARRPRRTRHPGTARRPPSGGADAALPRRPQRRRGGGGPRPHRPRHRGAARASQASVPPALRIAGRENVVSTDPFDQLRPVDPPPPDARFVARLRGRVQAALTDADLPVIDFPERTTTMTDTRTTAPRPSRRTSASRRRPRRWPGTAITSAPPRRSATPPTTAGSATPRSPSKGRP